MNWQKDFRGYLKRRDLTHPEAQGRTHALEVWRLCAEGLGDFIQAPPRVWIGGPEGIRAEVLFEDGLSYEIQIKPIRAADGKGEGK